MCRTKHARKRQASGVRPTARRHVTGTPRCIQVLDRHLASVQWRADNCFFVASAKRMRNRRAELKLAEPGEKVRKVRKFAGSQAEISRWAGSCLCSAG